jgi:hypothetical protein
MRRLALLGTLLTLLGSLLLLPAGNATARTGAVAGTTGAHAVRLAARRLTPTPYAFGASGFGTRIRGGEIPASSGTTAWRATGCTNGAGVDRGNHQAEVDIPGLGTISGLDTRVWTTKRRKTYGSHASHTIAGITLAESSIGRLVLRGVRTTAHATHDPSGFHARTSLEVAKLRLVTPTGETDLLDLPAAGQELEVPGVPLRIAVGPVRERAGRAGASARASGLLVTLTETNTVVRIASSRAVIAEGLRAGLMSGYAAGLRVDAVDSIVSTGRTPLLTMPCQGTGGMLRTDDLAEVDVPGVAEVSGLATSERATQTRRGGRGFTQARVASVSLLDGAIEIDGITGRANVVRRGSKVVRNADGTSTARLTLNGEVVELPDFGTLDLGGLATVQQRVVERTRKGIKVVALRVKLLDGTGATIDLGIARFQIARAVR